jgi:STE24 endopeptidase
MEIKLKEAWIQHDKSIKPYRRHHLVFSLPQKAISLFATIWIVRFEGVKWLSYFQSHFSNSWLVWLGFFASVGVLFALASLPGGMGHQAVEKKFGLSKQSWGSYFVDQAKGIAVGVVLGTVVMSWFYLCATKMGILWWLYCALGMLLFSVVLAQLAPVIFIPLFYPLKPMEDTELKEKLIQRSLEQGVVVKEVYHLGLGEKTEKGNAAFTGLGRTKKIMIGDTLYQKFPKEEVEAVFAHELGHQVNNDLWKGIGLSSVFMLFSFFVSDLLFGKYLASYFQTSIDSPYGFFLFLVTLSAIQMPLGVFQAMFSRYREREADKFATEKMGLGKELRAGLERLTYQNRGQFKPNALMEFLFHSHPAPYRRISS